MNVVARTVVIASSAVVIAVAAGGTGAGSSSPLAAYPGFGHDPDRDEARFEREERQREDSIARCMRSSGFDYFPAPSTIVSGAENKPPRVDDRNDSYVAGLSPAQRGVYFVTLTGHPDPYEPDAPVPTADSCVGSAFRRVRGVFAARQELAEEVEELEQAIATDPRVTRATQRWSECMHRRGFDVSDPSAVDDAIDREVARMLASRSYDRSRLDEFEGAQTRARKAGKACDPDRLNVWRDVRIEFETAFVNGYRDVLDSYR